MLINALRAHLAEFGIVMPQGRAGVATLVTLVEDDEHDLIPTIVRQALLAVADQLRDTYDRIRVIELKIQTWHQSNEQSRRFETIPGIGPITASSIAATITDASMFRSGRELAAWIGLVPRQNSSGGKERIGHISKKGDAYLRRLLVIGAHAVLRFARNGKATTTKWAATLLARKPYKLAAVALANKMARNVWALLTKNENFRLLSAA